MEEAAEKSWRRSQMGRESRQDSRPRMGRESRSWTGRESRTRMGRGSRTQGRRRRRPAARFQVSRRAPLSLSPPFPSLDWRESDGCVFGGRYARAAPSFPRARASVSCAHATLRSSPRARNALRFPRARNPRLPAPARGFPPALARARRPPRASRRHGDDLGCKVTPYARMPWRARRHGSKNARTKTMGTGTGFDSHAKG